MKNVVPITPWFVSLVLFCGATACGQLPRVDTPKDQLSGQVQVLVNGFRIEGGTIFTTDQLNRVAARALVDANNSFEQVHGKLKQGHLNRKLFTEDLETVRVALTLVYIRNGYINSGVILPDQKIGDDGIIRFQIVEGSLKSIVIEGNKNLSADFVRERVRLDLQSPLNVEQLKERLEIVRQSPLFKAINADLQPAGELGQALLNVKVNEANAMNYGIRFNNRRSPSVGAERFIALFSHLNVTGHGDSLNVEWGLTKGGIGDDLDFGGVDDISIAYSVPVTAYDTSLTFAFSRSDTLLVEEPFGALDIQSESTNYVLSIRHPLMRKPRSEFALSGSIEMRNSRTSLLGVPFSFSPGDHNGESDVTVLRLTQEYSASSQVEAIALRSTFSFGLDAFGATNNGGNLPDGRFVTWVGQAQYLQKLWDSNNQLVIRASTQLASDPLLSIEQLSIGGMDTVRGYRENQLVRDNGVSLSLEVRVPILFDTSTGRATLVFTPFLDFGYGWFNGAIGRDGKSIVSVGTGIVYTPTTNISMRVYWGLPFQDFDDTEDDLQDAGIHFDFLVLRF